jgi:hypothetical protein
MPLTKQSLSFQHSPFLLQCAFAKYPIKTRILPYKYDFLFLPTFFSLLLFSLEPPIHTTETTLLLFLGTLRNKTKLLNIWREVNKMACSRCYVYTLRYQTQIRLNRIKTVYFYQFNLQTETRGSGYAESIDILTFLIVERNADLSFEIILNKHVFGLTFLCSLKTS